MALRLRYISYPMAQKVLNVESRDLRGKVAARQLRRAGKLPAVIYGHGETPVSLSVNTKEFSDLIAHSGVHVLLTLKGASTETAFIKKLERHPVKGTPFAIDFQRVSLNERITAKVAIVLLWRFLLKSRFEELAALDPKAQNTVLSVH